jgi:hypothetical protein
MNTTELATLMWAAKRAADAIEKAYPATQQLELNHLVGGLAIVGVQGLRVEVYFDQGDLCERVYRHRLATAEMAEQCALVAEALGVELEVIR